MTDDAMFRPSGASGYEPTEYARGAWDPSLLHGAAAAALVAGRMVEGETGTLARFTVEFLAAIPYGRLELVFDDPAGGRRVQRRGARLVRDDKVVLEATAVMVAANPLDLPERTRRHHSPFDPVDLPALDEPNHAAAGVVGHDGFDSHSVIVDRFRHDEDRRLHQWLTLARPVLDGHETLPIETAVVAADYAQGAVYQQLPFAEWMFRNAEQTIHFARPPLGSWVGARYEAVVEPYGTGFNSADLFDEEGRFAQSAASLVVERR